MIVFSSLILRLPRTTWMKNKSANWNVQSPVTLTMKDNGRIFHKQAVEKAYQEYDIFNKTQPIESDFDRMVKGLAKAEK